LPKEIGRDGAYRALFGTAFCGIRIQGEERTNGD
jgi:hypothetical protein